MKILFIQNFFLPELRGGAELLCGDLIGHFRNQGHTVALLTSRSTAFITGASIISRLRSLPLVPKKEEMETISYKILWVFIEVINKWVTTNTIYKFKPDTVYIHNLEWVTSGPLYAAKKAGARIVIHAHNHHYDNLNEKNVEFIAISQSIANGIRFMPRDKIHLVYNGIPSVAFRQIDLKGERPYKALFVGALSSHKGVHIAIEAVINAKMNGIPIQLEIIGDSRNQDYIAQCNNMVKKVNAGSYITFSGTVAREIVWQKLAGSMVLLFPSLCEEAFGLVAAEAMANGAIVIGSNRGAIPEVIGDCGKIVEPDAGALAQAILDIAAMPHEELVLLRTRAKQRVKELFLLEERFKEIETIVCGA